MAAHQQRSCLENPMDRGAWQAAVHGVTQRQTRLCAWTHTHKVEALLIRNLVNYRCCCC